MAVAEMETVNSAPNSLIDTAVPLGMVRPSTFNPRKRFDEAGLQELADSIREHGLLEPIVVRLIDGAAMDDREQYEIVAGERRYRACQMVGLEKIPVRIHPALSDEQALKLALVENLQRQDLDPLEEAEGYRSLASLGMRQAEIAAAVKRSQPAIANTMRLLRLPEAVRAKLSAGVLTASHGVALASYDCNEHVQEALAEMAVKEGWTTKNTERYFAKLSYLPDELKQHVCQVAHRSSEYWQQCASACPHGAYRAGAWYGHGYCLRPGCYEKRLHEFKQLEAVKAESLREAAVIKGEDLPKLSDMAWESYKEFDRWTKAPEGCVGLECPKVGWALRYGGAKTQICTDVKCWRRLELAATRARNKAGREHAAELTRILEERIDNLHVVGPREMAILATLALEDWRRRQAVDETCERQGVRELVGALKNDHGADSPYSILAGCTVVELVKLAIETTIRSELKERYQEQRSGSTPITDWYLGEVERTCSLAGLPCDPAACVQDCPTANAAQGNEPATAAVARCDVCIPANCDDRCEYVEGGEGS